MQNAYKLSKFSKKFMYINNLIQYFYEDYPKISKILYKIIYVHEFFYKPPFYSKLFFI